MHGIVLDVVSRVLDGYHIDPAIKKKIAVGSADAFIETTGGQTVYIAKATTIELERTRKAAITMYDGTNRDEVCQRFGITHRQFYDWTAKAGVDRRRLKKGSSKGDSQGELSL